MNAWTRHINAIRDAMDKAQGKRQNEKRRDAKPFFGGKNASR
jgi:hypothetical protein